MTRTTARAIRTVPGHDSIRRKDRDRPWQPERRPPVGNQPASAMPTVIGAFRAGHRRDAFAELAADPVPQRRRADPEQFAHLLAGLDLRDITTGNPVGIHPACAGLRLIVVLLSVLA